RDEELTLEIARVHRDNFGVYGVEKVWRQLTREGIRVGRDRVARLMDDLDLEGVVRGKRKPITTMATQGDTRPNDLVERNFTASAPNALWVADLTYVRTWSGFVYGVFIIDVFQPLHRRLARLTLIAGRGRSGCAGDGHLETAASGSCRARAPQRQ